MLDRLERSLLLPTPIEQFTFCSKINSSIRFFIKRDDLIHPHICGNKWRKLKYNFKKIIGENYKGVVTLGGAFSNHLVSVAAVGAALDIPTVGLLRSYEEQLDSNNPTIRILQSYRMKLHAVHPSKYDELRQGISACDFNAEYDSYYFIPEGGTNHLALMGVAEMMQEIETSSMRISHIVVGVGTGGTLAGIANYIEDKKDIEIVAISPFKGAIDKLNGFMLLTQDVKNKINIIPHTPPTRFGAHDRSLIEYIAKFYNKNGIVLDPIYTGKVFRTIEQLCLNNYFQDGSNILIIHTGGLQGIAGYEYRHQCGPLII